MAQLAVLENKLMLSQEAVDILEASAGDRIAINYVQVTNQETFPVIGKSDSFVDPNSGNKLTKSNTVSFRGIQRDMLSKYGTNFNLELYKNKMYKLVKEN
jgi:hypothetical protein